MFAGQSPGRGDVNRGAGGDGAPGADAADEEPQAEIEVPIPIAAMARNIAEPPTALPMAARNSRRAIPPCLSDTRSPDRRIPGWTPNYRANSIYRGPGDARRESSHRTSALRNRVSCALTTHDRVNTRQDRKILFILRALIGIFAAATLQERSIASHAYARARCCTLIGLALRDNAGERLRQKKTGHEGRSKGGRIRVIRD